MSCAGILERFAWSVLLHLLGIPELREQLSQSPDAARRHVGGAAILSAHLRPTKPDPSGIGQSKLTPYTDQRDISTFRRLEVHCRQSA